MVVSKILNGRYMDSLETLFASSLLNGRQGITVAYVGMATEAFKKTARELGLLTDEIRGCSDPDCVFVAEAADRETFERAVEEVLDEMKVRDSRREQTYYSLETALADHPEANLCSISVPGEYALGEVRKALNAGLHCVVFSNNVPLEDEREMKELARSKGLLCMGPDCGVANINGAALVLASINDRGPFGICGASGVGIQHVAAVLHEAGSGVSQTIGTGGNDLKEPVGGLMMLEGIDALEADPQTEYLVLISRKPAQSVYRGLLERLKTCRKPRVVFFMDSDREEIEATGSVWARNLDDCAAKCLALIGRKDRFETDEMLAAMAAEAVRGVLPGQKYLRGLFSGGTFMDEAIRTVSEFEKDIWSNSPNYPERKLPDSHQSMGHCIIDYGEEEFTMGRPHPAIDPGVRRPAILKEASDPETAILLMDFILTPPGHPDPVGFVIEDIRQAQKMAADRGGKLIVIASVLGTDKDLQDKADQIRQLKAEGVYVCSSNYRAARLAGMTVRLLNEKER